MPPPFAADAALGPLECPGADRERPPTIRNLADLPLHEGREGRLAYATRDARDMGSERLVLAHGRDAARHAQHRPALPFRARGGWYVRGGCGVARLGEEAHELRAGLVLVARGPTAASGTGSRSGRTGMDLITMGDLIPGDVVAYPEKRIVRVARGVELPYAPRTERGAAAGRGKGIPGAILARPRVL